MSEKKDGVWVTGVWSKAGEPERRTFIPFMLGSGGWKRRGQREQIVNFFIRKIDRPKRGPGKREPKSSMGTGVDLRKTVGWNRSL